MKKQFIIAAVLLMGLIGCQKDVALDTQSAITSAETATKTKSLFDSEPATYKADVMQKIKAFEARLEKIEDGTLPKNDASMAVEAVIWNVEALMNLNYGKAQLPFDELQTESATIEVPLDADGNITNAALLAAAQTLRANTGAQLRAALDTKRHVVAIDVAKKAIQTAPKDYLTLEIKSSIGVKREVATSRTYTPPPYFGVNDNWGAVKNSGRCTNGANAPRWSGSELAEALNVRHATDASNLNVFFTSIQTIYIGRANTLTVNFRTPNDPKDNVRDYLLYVNERSYANSDAQLCINSSDMNWYLDNWWGILIPGYRPSGKYFAGVSSFEQDGVPGISTEHGAYILYGVKNYSVNPGFF